MIEDYANLRPDTPFNHLFPDNKVPIAHPLPVKPSEEAPVCWQIDGRQLTEAQLQGLAELVLEKTLTMSIDEIKAKILSDGLPMNQEYFTGVTITDQKTIAVILDLTEDFRDECAEEEEEEEYGYPDYYYWGSNEG